MCSGDNFCHCFDCDCDDCFIGVENQSNREYDFYYGKNKKGEQVVVCKISNCAEELIDELEKKINADRTFLYANRLRINDEYIGKAVCLKEDEFNASIGENIAKQKAHNKINKAKSKALERFKNTYTDNFKRKIEGIVNLEMKYNNKIK